MQNINEWIEYYIKITLLNLIFQIKINISYFMYNSSLNRSIDTANKSIKLERFPIFTEEYYLEGSSSELV